MSDEFNFDDVIDRRNTNSFKWQFNKDDLPMWVADMDFKTSPEIIKAIKKKLDHGIFGYSIIPDKWYEAYINWFRRRHDSIIKKDWLIFSTEVVASISSIIRKLTSPAENILVQTPCYNIFFNCIYNNGRNILENKLAYKNDVYEIDWIDLEKKLSDPQTSMMILCSPHNPIGKVWPKKDLIKIGALCKKYNVIVLSDEIHCDLVDKDCEYRHTPFASVNKTCESISIMCVAPTKSFNIAGIKTSAVIIPNRFLRHKVWRALNTDEIAEPNIFAIDAAIAAFNNKTSERWLDNLLDYLRQNKEFVYRFIKKELPELLVMRCPATYLLWINCEELVKQNINFAKSNINLAEFIYKTSGLYLSDGKIFGGESDNFLRLNIACPRIILKDGLERLKKSVLALKDL